MKVFDCLELSVTPGLESSDIAAKVLQQDQDERQTHCYMFANTFSRTVEAIVENSSIARSQPQLREHYSYLRPVPCLVW